MKIKSYPDKAFCQKAIENLVKEAVKDHDASDNFLPIFEGDNKGVKPSAAEKSAYKKYMSGLKEETGKRLLEILHHKEHGDMDLKYWLTYGKKNFCNMKFNNSL